MDITLAPVIPRSAMIILVTSMGNSLKGSAQEVTKRFAMKLFQNIELQSARPRRRVVRAIKRVATKAMQKPLLRSVECDRRVLIRLIQGWEGSRVICMSRQLRYWYLLGD